MVTTRTDFGRVNRPRICVMVGREKHAHRKSVMPPRAFEFRRVLLANMLDRLSRRKGDVGPMARQ